MPGITYLLAGKIKISEKVTTAVGIFITMVVVAALLTSLYVLIINSANA